jgi:hypothetical protein
VKTQGGGEGLAGLGLGAGSSRDAKQPILPAATTNRCQIGATQIHFYLRFVGFCWVLLCANVLIVR